MSARSYMSIGDVLTLLRQEFPDVTISKIRFLESQGLVNPERTPSGYRKFYEHDVERLRWVLRQQREHFLPLKVIKDRLDDDAGGAEAEAGSSHTAVAVVASEESPRAEALAEEAPHRAAPGDGQGHVDEESGRPVLVGQRAGERGAGTTLPGIESTVTSTTTAAAATVGAVDSAVDRPSSSAPGTAPGAGTMGRPPASGGADSHGSAGGVPVGSAARRSRPAGG